jgi:hypothetical protein
MVKNHCIMFTIQSFVYVPVLFIKKKYLTELHNVNPAATSSMA